MYRAEERSQTDLIFRFNEEGDILIILNSGNLLIFSENCFNQRLSKSWNLWGESFSENCPHMNDPCMCSDLM